MLPLTVSVLKVWLAERAGVGSDPLFPTICIGDRAEACLEAFASRERVPFGEALRRCDEVQGMAPRSAKAVREFADLMDELRALVIGNMPPAEVLDAVLDRTGYLTELAESSDPQDESRVKNLSELVGVAREFEERVPDGGVLADAVQQWAFCSMRGSPGARAYHQALRARNIGHQAAIRQLANRQVGILHGCLKHRTVYDEQKAWPPHATAAA